VTDKPILTDGRQGAYTVAACQAITESARKDESIRVNYDF